MSIVSDAIKKSRDAVALYRGNAANLKSRGQLGMIADPGFSGTLSQWQTNAKYQQRYELFRGVLYSAINAIAEHAAGQPVKVGKLEKEEEGPKKPGKTKYLLYNRMTKTVRAKAEMTDVEVLEDHNLVKALENPNSVQGRWQFVYSFIANLCLTGWSYVVADVKKDGTPELWSLPTTWVKPDHSKGPFTKFKIGNPRSPASEWQEFDRSQVGFAHLPNPCDPLSALSPTGSQMPSIRISDHIEASREQFFHNGIFPSVIVTIGKNPHPDVSAQSRPRLSGAQRRQVYQMVRKVMAGVANYGNPAIVDGLIERIDKLSMDTNEMGWEKSDKAIESKILSAFCVHPFILGREMNVGGWAQATIIRQLFFDRVNVYLDFLGNVVTNLVGGGRDDNSLVIWWERCEAKDPQQEQAMVKFARQNNDITQDELRAMLGLGPDEDRNEQVIEKSTLQAIVTMLGQVAQSNIEVPQAVALLEGLGLPSDMAKKIVGPKRPKPPAPQPGVPGQVPPKPGQNPQDQQQNLQQNEEEQEPVTTEEAVKQLKRAVDELKKNDPASSKRIAEWVVDLASAQYGEKFNPNHGPDGRFSSSGGGGGAHMAPDTGTQIGGSSSSTSGMAAVKRRSDGKLVMSNGKPLPDHIPKNIPPAWTHVTVALNAKAELLVKGKDAKGRGQFIYSEGHWAKAAQAKFSRTNELRKKQAAIRKELDKDASSSDPGVRENAACLRLIQATGIRPGGTGNTKAEKQAYGATTIEGRHVRVSSSEKVKLVFTGKKGVGLNIEVTDPVVKKDLIARKKAAGANGKIFDTSDTKLSGYSHSKDGGGFKTKDFRTAVGTSTAVEVMKGMKAPTNQKEYKKAVKEVAKRVSAKLGNTPTVALQSYIDPAVFSQWRVE